MDVVAVVVSSGLRSGPVTANDLDALAGVPMVTRSVRGLVVSEVAQRVVVLCPAERRQDVAQALSGLPVSVLVPDDVPGAVWCPSPAAQPTERPGRGEATPIVVVHDACRPLAPLSLVNEVVSAVAAGHPVAVPVLPCSDTVKRVSPDGLVVGTVDRSSLRVVQTPQAFRADVADAVLRAIAAGVSPERAYTAVPEPAYTVEGHPLAFAVRGSWDRDLAEVLAGRAQ